MDIMQALLSPHEHYHAAPNHALVVGCVVILVLLAFAVLLTWVRDHWRPAADSTSQLRRRHGPSVSYPLWRSFR